MFDPDRFVADCRAALADERPSRAVRDLIAAAVAEPEAILARLGPPVGRGLGVLHRSSDLTVLNVTWPAHAVHAPHDHRTWAVIGVYAGREDNILWRRLDNSTGIEAAGAKSLGVGDVLAMGPEAIHSVINPVAGTTGALHVYGGDFFAIERSEWDPLTLTERPYDRQRALSLIRS